MVELFGQVVQSGGEGVLAVLEPPQECARGCELASGRVDAEEVGGVTLCPAGCLLDEANGCEATYGLRCPVDLQGCEMLLIPAFFQEGRDVFGAVTAGAVGEPGSAGACAPVGTDSGGGGLTDECRACGSVTVEDASPGKAARLAVPDRLRVLVQQVAKVGGFTEASGRGQDSRCGDRVPWRLVEVLPLTSPECVDVRVDRFAGTGRDQLVPERPGRAEQGGENAEVGEVGDGVLG
ncbi:hypothetical protein [Streptomyces sp. NPDC002540]